jgi:hypothetical protein
MRCSAIILLPILSLMISCGNTIRQGTHTSNNIEKISNTPSNCDSCTASHFAELVKSYKTIGKKEILIFLKCYNKDCSNNVEFSEFSNSFLYKLLLNRTDDIIQLLSEDKSLDLNYIMEGVENPVVPQIDLKSILDKIISSKSDSITRNKLVNSIKIAIGKG